MKYLYLIIALVAILVLVLTVKHKNKQTDAEILVFKDRIRGSKAKRIREFISKRDKEPAEKLPAYCGINFMCGKTYYGYFDKKNELYIIHSFVPKEGNLNYERINIKRSDKLLLKRTFRRY